MDPSEFGFQDFYGETQDGQSGAVNLMTNTPATVQPPPAARRAPAQQPAAMTEKERRKAEAKHRIRLAGYYEAAQESELFEDMNDPYARQVQAEVAAFLEGRIEFLTGVGEPQAPAQFTAQEVQALKALAGKLLGASDEESPAPEARQPAPAAPPPAPPPPPERRVAQAPQVSRPTPRKAPVAKQEPIPAPPAPSPIPTPPPAAPNAPKGKHGGRRVKGQKVAPAAPPPPPAAPPPGRIPFPTGLAMQRAMELKAHEALASAQVVDTGTTEVKTR